MDGYNMEMVQSANDDDIEEMQDELQGKLEDAGIDEPSKNNNEHFYQRRNTRILTSLPQTNSWCPCSL